jgi:hypothetical protein
MLFWLDYGWQLLPFPRIMITKFLATLFAGAALGTGITWSVMKDRQPKPEIVSAASEEEAQPSEESLSHDTDADPFAYPGPPRDRGISASLNGISTKRRW